MGILRLSHQVSTHGIQQLVHGGGLGEKVQKRKGGNAEAEFPPQICGPCMPSPPCKNCATGCAGQCELPRGRGGVEGCCPDNYILHRKCPRPVCHLLHLVGGDGEDLVLRQGVGTSVRAGLHRRAATKSDGTWSQKEAKKGSESCEKAKQWELGQIHLKFVKNS